MDAFSFDHYRMLKNVCVFFLWGEGKILVHILIELKVPYLFIFSSSSPLPPLERNILFRFFEKQMSYLSPCLHLWLNSIYIQEYLFLEGIA